MSTLLTGDRKRFRSDVWMAAILVALGGMFLYDATRAEPPVGDVRTYSTLYVCSQGATCDSSVMTLDYTLTTRQPFFQVALDIAPDEALDVLVQDITVEFQNSVDELVTPGDQMFLYVDSDADGVFDSDVDTRVASATVKGRRIKFENLNMAVSEPEVPAAGLELHRTMFISGSGIDQLISTNPVDGLTVEAQNLLLDSAPVIDVASFIDNDMFANGADMVLSRQEFLDANPAFEAGLLEGEVFLPAGSHTFEETVVVPLGLTGSIAPGTVIEIAGGASFVSYSPIQMQATADDPIVIRPVVATEPFGTFAMIGAIGNTNTIRISHVQVAGGSEATVNGAFISGMFSIYRFGRTEVVNSEFKDAQADDGLNVKYSEVVIADNYFEGNSADAIDGDFVVGVLEGNYFIDNGNDALDFSGSDVTVQYNSVANSGDKCVSVGEATTALISHNVFTDCEIGIEVKDASSAVISENVISGSRSWAVSAYVKKYFFGEPSFEVAGNVLLENAALFGDLASVTDSASNVTAGTLEDLREELPWLAETLLTVPTR